MKGCWKQGRGFGAGSRGLVDAGAGCWKQGSKQGVVKAGGRGGGGGSPCREQE